MKVKIKLSEITTRSPMQPPEHQFMPGVEGYYAVTQYEQDLALNQNASESERFHKNMAETRELMAGLSSYEDTNSKIDAYFTRGIQVPEVIKFAKNQSEAETGSTQTWTEWLAQSATDEQVLNFLQWHTYTHEQRANSPEFNNEIERAKSLFSQKAEEMKKLGFIHPEAKVSAEDLAGIKVSYKDIFTSHNLGVGHSSDPEDGSIEMIEGFDLTDFWHELTHSSVGRLAENSQDNSQWLNEAVTEHIARTMTYGEFEAVDPHERTTGEGAYILERQLLGALLNGGTKKIDPKYVTLLYSAKSVQSRQKAERELKDQFNLAYGEPDMLDLASEYIGPLANFSGSEEDSSDEYKKAVQDLIKNPKKLVEISINKKRALAAIYYAEDASAENQRRHASGAQYMVGSGESIETDLRLRRESEEKAGLR